MQFFESVENRAPAGAVCSAIITDDGVQLRTVTVPLENARGTVLILGGRAEYVERYFETMRDLQARGFAVVAFDWRGQGGSQRLRPDRNRGYVRHFRDYTRDLESVLKQCVLGKLPAPLHALAHSTGGLILLNRLQTPSPFVKAVVTAALVDVNYKSWPKPVARIITKLMHYSGLGWAYLPGLRRLPFKRNEFEGNPLTSDHGRWNRDLSILEQHPELAIGGPTFSWFKGALDYIDDLNDWSAKLPTTCPVLLICADEERVVHPRAARAFADKVPGVSYIEIEDAKHEILMERSAIRKQFWSAFDAFVGLSGARSA
jgi:lysophospholipase